MLANSWNHDKSKWMASSEQDDRNLVFSGMSRRENFFGLVVWENNSNLICNTMINNKS